MDQSSTFSTLAKKYRVSFIMSIDHLYYCVEEIDAAHRFIGIRNNDFYKRAVARLIAVRTEDFVKIGLQLNNATLKDRKIRADFVALGKLYEEFFQLQRDKFGAHFQKLDLISTLQAWSAINFEKVDFFAPMALECYRKFRSAPGYVSFNPEAVSSDEEVAILEVNKDLDIESYPNLSSDLLSHTRPNSPGFVHGGPVKHKMGVIKSIELLLNYELAMLRALLKGSNLREMFTKLFITDLVNYSDNFYTRSDIQPGAPQYELGLDHVLNDKDTPQAHEIITKFRKNYRFDEQLSKLRIPRNATGGHIDTGASVASLRGMITSFDENGFERFFIELKNLYKSICQAEIFLLAFAAEPTDRIGGVGRFVGLPTTTFDGGPTPTELVEDPPYDDEATYEDELKKWLVKDDSDAVGYFYRCFNDSPVITRIEIREDTDNGGGITRHYDFRKSHQFFKNKLADPSVPLAHKFRMIELFRRCAGGHPSVLGYILWETYPKDQILQRSYLRGLSYLVRTRSNELLAKVDILHKSGEFNDRFIALTSLFRCDLRARHNNSSRHFSEETVYSKYIVEKVVAINDGWERSAFSMALASIYSYDNLIKTEGIENLYIDALQAIFQETIRKLVIEKGISFEDDRVKQAFAQFAVFRFAEVINALSDLFEDAGFLIIASRYRTFLLEGYVRFEGSDDDELKNYVLVSYRDGKIDEAIRIVKFLIKKRPHEPDYRKVLLSILLADKKYEVEFDLEKRRVLHSFNLELSVKEEIEKMGYDA